MRFDVLGADAHAYEAGQSSTEEGMGREEAEGEGWFDGGGIAKSFVQEAVDRDLKGLCDAGGELAALLDMAECEVGDDAGGERGGEDACCGYGVLDGEVYSDAADRGHGMGGIADTEEAGTVPAGKAVDLDGEELDLAPVGDLVYAGFTVGVAGAKERDETGEGGAEGG